MKKSLLFIAAILTAAFLFSVIFASAEEAPMASASTAFNPVADYADLFTDAQEAAMQSKIASIRNTYGYDLVVLTSLTTGDLEYDEYCQNFWTENDLGLGTDKSGSILFICMDPEDSYWVNRAYGKAADIFTSAVKDYIDLDLGTYLTNGYSNDNANGEYGQGVLLYLDALNAVYANGGKVPVGIVSDYADLFTDAQEAAMKKKIAEIKDKYGYDIIIVTEWNNSGYSRGTDAFYNYLKLHSEDIWFDNGFGTGKDQTGSMLLICMDNVYHGGWWTNSYGDLRSVYTEEMINAIDDRLEPDMISGSEHGNSNGEYGQGVLNYLDNIALIYENGGNMPSEWKEPLEWGYPIILAIIVGLIAGIMTVSKQKRRMRTVAKAGKAKGYLRDGSFRREELGDVLIGVTVTKTARSSSSSSGGRSSYSSSGRSSGGGRSF